MSPAQANRNRSQQRPDESGAVLVLFALLLFGVFGMLGVVVDGGRLRVTKQQLDAGVEIAALEGLRFKDREGDAARRLRAIDAAAMLWDDDLDPDNGDAMGLGAGTLPIVRGDEPFGGDIVTSTVAAERVWKPARRMQTNDANLRHGDLVAGTHVALGSPAEDDAFVRQDFVPAAAGSNPDQLGTAPSFLVRLRRATDRLDLDRQDGVSSAGPAFEWLWARGSAWQEPGPGEALQSRSTGVTLRATAIASSERALVVTRDPTGATTLATFGLRGDGASLWNGTASGAALTLDIAADGSLTASGTEQGILLLATAQSVGTALTPSTSTVATIPVGELIVPVYAVLGGGRPVIGFCRATATRSDTTLVVTRLPSAVLPSGASSVAPAALDARLALSQDPALRALHSTFSEPVLAPVLRR